MKRRDYIFCFLNEIKSHASEVISFWDHSGSIYNWVFLSWGLYVGLVRTISVSGNEVCVCMVVVVIVVGGDFFHYYYSEFVYCSVHLIMCVKSQRLPSCFPICPLTCNIVPSPLFFFILHMSDDQNVDFIISTSLMCVSDYVLSTYFHFSLFVCEGNL